MHTVQSFVTLEDKFFKTTMSVQFPTALVTSSMTNGSEAIRLEHNEWWEGNCFEREASSWTWFLFGWEHLPMCMMFRIERTPEVFSFVCIVVVTVATVSVKCSCRELDVLCYVVLLFFCDCHHSKGNTFWLSCAASCLDRESHGIMHHN
jgi:hypothetical protein